MGGLRLCGIAAIVAATLAVVAGPVSNAAAATGPCSEPAGRPWCDPSLSPDKRAGLLVAALTEDEKISLLAGTSANGHTGATAAVPRVGLPQSYNTDGPVGIRAGHGPALG